MSRNNDVFQILVTTGNQAVLDEGLEIDALAPGQIGVFDAETKLSIDGSSPTRHFFLAVGVDRDGDTVVDDINKSAGQYIQRANMRFYSFRPHTASQPMIAELVGFKANCDTDYAFKLEFRNQEIYRRQGYNQFSKTYAVRTSCCEECVDCPSGNCQELGNLLVDAINVDTHGLATAELFVNQATLTFTGEPTSDGDITVTIDGVDTVVAIVDADTAITMADKVVAAYAGSTVVIATTDGVDTVTFTPLSTVSNPVIVVTFDGGTTGATATTTEGASVVVTESELEAMTFVCPGIRITTNPVAINKFCDVNLKYYKPRQTVMIPSLIEGFNCNGTVSITQEAAYEEGNGYDVQQKEYHAGGWNGRPGPYRASSATGMSVGGFEYFADKTLKYDQIALTYDQQSIAGWGEHLNNLATVIAIPTAGVTTTTGLIAILDALLTPLGFDALADDAALANATITVVEPTSAIDDPNADGIA